MITLGACCPLRRAWSTAAKQYYGVQVLGWQLLYFSDQCPMYYSVYF